jgi:CheY-like chemotaxis protein
MLRMKLNDILIAEDNDNDLELTVAALAERNLANRLVVVRDGVETLEYLECRGHYSGRKSGNPAVILLDIKMPRMDGIEVLEKIKSQTAFRNIPVVMLTSSKEDRDLARTYELGVNAYVVKPVGFTEFVEAVKQIGAFWALLNELPPS